MRELKATDSVCGLCVMLAGLGTSSYYVRELLACLALFTMAFFALGLAVFGVILVWCTGVVLAARTVVAWRNLVAFSRRLFIADVKP